MNGIRHPFSGALYEQDGSELRECDPQLCGWVFGPQYANHRMSKSGDAAG